MEGIIANEAGPEIETVPAMLVGLKAISGEDVDIGSIYAIYAKEEAIWSTYAEENRETEQHQEP